MVFSIHRVLKPLPESNFKVFIVQKETPCSLVVLHLHFPYPLTIINQLSVFIDLPILEFNINGLT